MALPALGQPLELSKIVQSEVQAAMTQARLPGLSVAVLHDNKPVLAQGFGYAELDNSVAASEHTVYRINSITKAFTAVAILQLLEKGKLSLDDHLSKWFPEYSRPGHDPTVRQLLTHTSGLANYHGAIFKKNIHLDLSAKEWVDSLNGDGLYLFSPGTNWSYSNLGYDVLGLLVEKLGGKPLEEYFRSNILAPAGMMETSYCNTRRVVKNRAFSYAFEKGNPVHAESWGTYGNASDRLCSTATDLGAFLVALDSGKLLSPRSLALMHGPGEVGSRTVDYGLGTRLGHLGERALVAYTGSGEEWTSAAIESPADHWAVVVLCNADVQRWSATRVASDILRRLLDLPPAQQVQTAISQELAKAIGGVWRPADEQAMEFVVEGGAVRARPLGAPVPPVPLVSLGQGRFTFGEKAPAEGVEFDFYAADPPSVQVYQDGVFSMMVVRSPHD